jgi:hypothetical protein
MLSCALLALVLTGCSRPVNPLPKYRRETARICADAVHQLRALPTTQTNADLIAVVRRVRAINRRMTERIAALDAPRGTRGEQRQNTAVDIGVRMDIEARELLKVLVRSPQPRRELERRRRALRRAAGSDLQAWAKARLRACAPGPSVALARVGEPVPREPSAETPPKPATSPARTPGRSR